MLTFPQQIIIILFAVFNFFIFFKALDEVKRKKNAFGLTRGLVFLGAFVWADAVIFSLFWLLSSAIVLALSNWNLFLLIISVFWLVRSIGETIYWFNQQFSTLERNPPKNLHGYTLFNNDSIWFVYQIIWQSVTVFSLISSIYLAKIWLIG